MGMGINEPVTIGECLRDGFLLRDGFVFTSSDDPSVFDTLVVRNPRNAMAFLGCRGFSDRALSEHITLINSHRIEKVTVICEDLSFITKCPSIKSINVYPADTVGNGFDFSSLCQLPNIEEVNCCTEYGFDCRFRSNMDYTKLINVKSIAAAGNGHMGYEKLSSLEKIWVSNDKKKKTLDSFSSSTILRDITLMQCGIQTLAGVEHFPLLESLVLYSNRSLCDIGALSAVASTLKTLAIENSAKILDFSVLQDLVNLEHLHLYGSNTLNDLRFLKEMKKLKTFCFTMNVEDGDLALCKKIPYVSCKNRKHYNLKDHELPKED